MSGEKRRYESPLRAQRAADTRAAIIVAATELFTTKGWAATGMREVARDAGVAVETVYSQFPSKRRLLDSVVDLAVVGDDAPVPVAARPEFLLLGTGRRSERIAAAARLTTAINRRTAVFAKVLREAAPSDAEIADALAATRERQRADVGRGLASVLGREPTADERDGVWAVLSPEVYLLLVEVSGWSDERYERWLAATIGRLLRRT